MLRGIYEYIIKIDIKYFIYLKFDFSSKGTKERKKGLTCPPTDKSYEAPKSAFQPLLDDDIEKEKAKRKCLPESETKYNEIRVVQPPSPEIPKPDPVTKFSFKPENKKVCLKH
ncbi:hypothetical protein Phum_PHUM228650 [Pediculus humanus corporis]|uniref:Uncharacterized protein n=1 Tax=Pediculus humanus subsp. corporis TaxID=121224 RepID=E0VIK2_PEDHC|nr:uncharacterized protein Phum_PHUM228650 [Pediculus humanus corporis]EEB13208.1 hypothetical protein Phum_PHUM228650 [Pediculus humanus corporis]